MKRIIIYQNVLFFNTIPHSLLLRVIFLKHAFAFEIKLILLCVCVIIVNKSFLYKIDSNLFHHQRKFIPLSILLLE